MAKKVRVKTSYIAKDKIPDVEKLNGEIIFAKENDKITEALVGTIWHIRNESHHAIVEKTQMLLKRKVLLQ